MGTAHSLEKSLMLGKIEGRRRREHQKMRWLGGITDAMDMNLGKLREIVRDREAWHAAVHGVTKIRTWLGNWTATTYCKHNIYAQGNKKIHAILYFNIYFISLVWNQTHSISEVCLILFMDHINRKKEKLYMTSKMQTEKAFDKIQYHSWKKILSKFGIRALYEPDKGPPVKTYT